LDLVPTRRSLLSSERALTTSVNNIEQIESSSFNGIAVIKVYLQPQASIDAAIAETTAECQTILKTLPQGMTPPNILNDNAANVPVLQLSVGGQSSPSSNSTISQPTLFVPNWLPYKARPFHCLTAGRPAPYRWTSTQTSCKPITSRRKKWPTRSINKALCCLRHNKDRQTRV
jgi:hypothetical protein